MTWSISTLETNYRQDSSSFGFAVDSDGNSHIAYGGTVLEYAYSDGQTWQTEVFAPGAGASVAMALSGLDVPHMSYCAGGYLYYAQWTGLEWEQELVDTTCSSTAIALGPAVQPQIAYVDSTGHSLKYAIQPGPGRWETETVDHNSSQTIRAPAFAEGLGGDRHLVYANGNVLRYAYQTTDILDQWEIENIGGIATGSNVAFALQNPEGIPGVGYYFDGALHYATRQEGAWVQRPIDLAEPAYSPLDLAFDAGGAPYLLHSVRIPSEPEGTFTFELRLTAWNGSEWQPIDIPRTPVSEGAGRLAIHEGELHLAYFDSDRLNYAVSSAGEWETVAISPFETRIGEHPSLQLDSQDRGHVVYSSIRPGGSLFYRTPHVESAPRETIDPVFSRVFDLALDSSDTPYVLYRVDPEFGEPQFEMRYAYRQNETWFTETVPFLADGAFSIAVDTADTLHVSSLSLDGHLFYGKRTGNAGWSVEVATQSDVRDIAFTALAVDEAGNPHIAHGGARSGGMMSPLVGDLLYTYWTGEDWETSTVENLAVGYNVDLKLAADGTPHIVYIIDRTRDVKYATRVGDQWQIETLASGEDVSPMNVMLDLTADDTPVAAYYDYNSGQVRYTVRGSEGWTEKVVSGVRLSASMGPSSQLDLMLDSTGRPHLTVFDESHLRLLYVIGQEAASILHLPILESTHQHGNE
ncbi:MAG: hypothetical protein WDZ49_03445 [Litorilinea sp.]